MTELIKTIRRRTRLPVERGKRAVILLEFGDLISMRLEGKRTKYSATAEDVYWQLVKWQAARVRREKQLLRKKR